MRKLGRAAAIVTAGLMVATITTVSTGTATSPVPAAREVRSADKPAPRPSDRATDWLRRQLTDGLMYNEQFDAVDYGLTADVALAMSSGGEPRALSRIVKALRPHVDSWTTGADQDAPEDVYAGAVAKALVTVHQTLRDPRSYGGVDLVERLEDRVSAEGALTGRIEDAGSVDYANVIGQAYAAVGLGFSDSPRTVDARRFLLLQQCEEGWFRLNFSAKTAPDQSCDADETSRANTDATSLAVIMLGKMPRGKEVRRAARDATKWLLDARADNGSLGGGATTRRPNTNSTGLGALAIWDNGYCLKARRTARWVERLQVGGKLQGTSLEGERGAIAYNRAALRAARDEGITPETRDQWRRATAQAAASLILRDRGACTR